MKKVVLLLICILLVGCQGKQSGMNSNADQFLDFDIKEHNAYESGYATADLDGFDDFFNFALSYLNIDDDVYNVVSQRYFNEAGRYVYEYSFIVKQNQDNIKYDIALEPNDSKLGYNVTYLSNKKLNTKVDLYATGLTDSKKIIGKALEQYSDNLDDILMIGITKLDKHHTYEVYIQNKAGNDKYVING